MIAELPRKFIYAGGDIRIPTEEPFLKLTAIKDGALLYSDAGKLVGQVLTDKTGATVTTADAGSYRVKNDGGQATIVANSDKSDLKFDIFGRTDGYNYTLYEYRKGSVKPIKAAQVAPSVVKGGWYTVKVEEDVNVFRALMLTVAISLLTEGGKK